MIIRISDQNDREDIYKIWEQCFTEDSDYINSFLDNCFPFATNWVLCNEHNRPLSTLSIIPSFTTVKGKPIFGGYLYGVATMLEHRNRGYSKSLIEKAVEECKRASLSYLLVQAAENSLVNFYKKIGFSIEILNRSCIKTAKKDRQDMPANTLESTSAKGCNTHIEELSPNSLFQIRKKYSELLYLYPQEITAYALSLIKNSYGTAIQISIKSDQETDDLYILATKDSSSIDKQAQLRIIETDISSKRELDTIGTIADREILRRIDLSSLDPTLAKNREQKRAHSSPPKKNAQIMIFEEALNTPLKEKIFTLPME